MLTNATILRIDRSNGADAAGRTKWTAGSAIEVRCALDQISSRQRYKLGAVLEDADLVVFVERDALTSGGEIAPASGSRLTVLPDGSSTIQTLVVVTTSYALAPHSGALSHHELYVRREPS